MTHNVKLNKLRDELIFGGCNNFFISEISGNISPKNDVFCLSFNGIEWEVYYTERGIDDKAIFSTKNIDEAIDYFKRHILKMEHLHMILFTRSKYKVNEYKKILENNGIDMIQNNIPSYNFENDIVYRIFVKNNDIFRIKKIFGDYVYYD